MRRRRIDAARGAGGASRRTLVPFRHGSCGVERSRCTSSHASTPDALQSATVGRSSVYVRTLQPVVPADAQCLFIARKLIQRSTVSSVEMLADRVERGMRSPCIRLWKDSRRTLRALRRALKHERPAWTIRTDGTNVRSAQPGEGRALRNVWLRLVVEQSGRRQNRKKPLVTTVPKDALDAVGRFRWGSLCSPPRTARAYSRV